MKLVIIPTDNKWKNIVPPISSVLRQLPDLPIPVVADHFPARTGELIEQLAADFSYHSAHLPRSLEAGRQYAAVPGSRSIKDGGNPPRRSS